MLYEQFVKLYEAGKYAEAIPLAEQYAELTRRRFGDHHTEFAIALNNLAEVYRVQGRYADAERLFKHALQIEENSLGANHPNIAIRLFNIARLYEDQVQYDKIENLLKRALSIWEERPERHQQYIASTLNKLADLYCKMDRREDASPLHEQALIVTEAMFGRDHPEVAVQLNMMGTHYISVKQFDRAGILLTRAIDMDRKIFGSFHPNVAYALSNLAAIHNENKEFNEVERALLEALEIYQKSLGPEHPKIAEVCEKIGLLYLNQERYVEAEVQTKRAYEINQLLLGRAHITTARTMNQLGEIALNLGKLKEAEQLCKNALEILGKALGLKHQAVGSVFRNLAEMYFKQAKHEEAEKLYKCALEINLSIKDSDKQNDLSTADIYNNLALIAKSKEHYDEAETLLKKSLLLLEKTLGAADPRLAEGLIHLGQIYTTQGKSEAAIPFYKMALKSQEKNYGSENNIVAQTLNQLAQLHDTQKQHDVALPLYKCAADIQEKLFEHHNLETAQIHLKLAEAYLKQKKTFEAYASFKTANAILLANFSIADGVLDVQDDVATDPSNEKDAQHSDQDEKQVKTLRNDKAFESELNKTTLGSFFIQEALIAYRHSLKETDNITDLKNTAFIACQQAHNLSLTASYHDLLSHFSAEENDFANLLKERSHFSKECQTLQKELIAHLSKPKSTHKKIEMEYTLKEKTIRDGLKNITDSLDDVNFLLSEDFPEKITFLRPKTVSIDKIQQNLQADEALIKFVFSENEGLVFLITKEASEWVSLSIGEAQLKKDLNILKFGLNPKLWEHEQAAQAGRDLLGTTYGVKDYKAGKPLPYDLKTAHKIYRELFGDLAKFIKDKRLLVIMPPVMTHLPLSILVQEAPVEAFLQKYEDYQSVSWFGLAYPITILPTVYNFEILRSELKIGETKKTFLSFAPLSAPLDTLAAAHSNATKDKFLSALQYAKSCRQEKSKIDKLKGIFSKKPGSSEKTRQPLALDETAAEVMAIAEILGAPESDLIIGAQATEQKVQDISEDGKLKDYGIVYFTGQKMTPGHPAKNLKPSLSLTYQAPEAPKEDKLPEVQADQEKNNESSEGEVSKIPKEPVSQISALTTYDIAHLRLNADWVVISPVESGPRDGPLQNDAFLELSRAFLHAGARALLVSHWPQNPEAKVKLIAWLFESLKDNQIGRSEALREAMRLLVTDKSRPWNAHPFVWGGFSILGEGASY